MLCGAPISAHSIASDLQRQGFCQDLHSPIKIIVDVPQGFALPSLETLDRTSLRTIVATRNPCPEYWEDLWDLHPHVLLVGAKYDQRLAKAIVRAANGERYRITPKRAPLVSHAERKILHCIARGLGNEEIAEQLCVQEKTVRNTLTAIYQKLDMKNRTEAALYYWGIKQVLSGEIPPIKL